MPIFQYGEKEIQYLSKKDKKLGAAIERIGMVEREVQTDVFEALISSIVGQQISSKAAETVWGRVVALAGTITPNSLTALEVDALQKCGMSMRKAQYIMGVALAAVEGKINFAGLARYSDEEIVKTLTALNGVGLWTVEMLLIFSLSRPNVVSYNDLAIRRGMMKLYGHKELTKERFEKYKKRYSPYGTVASLYLWELSSDTWKGNS